MREARLSLVAASTMVIINLIGAIVLSTLMYLNQVGGGTLEAMAVFAVGTVVTAIIGAIFGAIVGYNICLLRLVKSEASENE
jgi:hypothetical protein